jgi:hypothetical protein
MFSSNTTQVSESGPDAQFNYVTMLLHGDGTNGAQNNTFVDSSTNNFTITRNGNTTQGSFSPYGSNWSNYFDGSGDYLSIPSNAAFAFGTGDFTVEGWIFYSSVASNAVRILATAGAAANCLVQVNTSSQIDFYDGVTTTTFTAATTSANTWTHIAVTRSGTSLRAFINGTQVGSAVTNTTSILSTQAINFPATTNYASTSCYLSNVRYVKGTAVYTSSFTPSTTPLTAISGTSLLTCQSNRFIENSANNFAVTVNGDTSVQRFNPFGTATAYSTSVIGGSGYFDGSGDYLNTASITIGTGDFTLEAWQYTIPNSSNYGRVFGVGGMFSSTGLGLNLNPSTMRFELVNNNTTIINPAQTYSYNSWNHLAVVRSGTTITLYINGVSQGTATNSNSLSGSIYTSAIDYLGTIYHGASYTNDLRLTNTSVYTTAFTPPTAPLTAISGTSLLQNMTNGAIFDNAMMNDLETVGNAQISTSVKKYGTGSITFAGTGDYLNIPQEFPISYIGGDATIEFWFYVTSLTGVGYFYSSTGFVPLYIYRSSSNLGVQVAGAYRDTTTSPISINTWYHVAVTKTSGNVYTIYVNGVSQANSGAGTMGSSISAGPVKIGNGLIGYIDDLRITNGFARYTTTFTPPTAAFSNTGPV